MSNDEENLHNDRDYNEEEVQEGTEQKLQELKRENGLEV